MNAPLAVRHAQPKGRGPGIYFGWDEDEYHADSALGSSDMRNLLLSPPDFWWGSAAHNPEWEQDENDDTPAKVRGRAMHKLVLEGEAPFAKWYARGPKQDPDATPAEKSAATKAAKKDLAPGRTLIPQKDYDRIAIAGAMITKNPKLAGAFTGGLSEVSVVWDRKVEDRTVRCKCRLDYLKPRGIGDLKSITNVKKIEFRRACRESIANYRYDIQAAHYLEGRRAMRDLYAAGAVHGAHDEELLERIMASKTFAFQFVFFQAAKAPVTWSTILSPANPMIENANNDLILASENYLRHLDAFGPSDIWLILDEPGELTFDEMPGWFAR